MLYNNDWPAVIGSLGCFPYEKLIPYSVSNCNCVLEVLLTNYKPTLNQPEAITLLCESINCTITTVTLLYCFPQGISY